MDFWERLRKELENKKITHSKFADNLDIPKNTLETRFARKSVPDAEFLYKCSQILNLTMDYLYTGKEKDTYKIKYDNLKRKIETALKEESL